MSLNFIRFLGTISAVTILTVCINVTASADVGGTAVEINNGPWGAPGIPHYWAPALKQAVGTSYEEKGAASPVWFTIAEGIVTEVFYPNIDQPQVGDLQFLVSDGKGFFSEQKSDTISTVSYSDEAATVRITGRDRRGKYSYEQEIITDVAAPVLRIRTTFKWNVPGLRVFVLYKPAINNTGAQNLGSATPNGLFATKQNHIRHLSMRNLEPVHTALLTSTPFAATSVGYVGFSDGWQDVSKNGRLTSTWNEAGPGNVALTGEVPVAAGSDFSFDIALGFGGTRTEAQTYAMTSLKIPFRTARNAYDSGWQTYEDSLIAAEPGKKRFMKESSFARRSAMIIKMHEDKRHRGAIVASLSKPGVPASDRAMDNSGGYHLVWPRDLYHAGMGLLAAGDHKTPVSVLEYYVQTQRKEGSWNQNFWIDGTPYWRGLQMDQVAFPILLAYQLQKRIAYPLSDKELTMVRNAANFLVANGPTSQQDRWEEIGGYIPSTIAAEIAALDAATKLTGDSNYANTANFWKSQLEAWTLVQDGPLGHNYYLRVSSFGNPNSPEPIELANGAGRAFAWEILDGGFLQLVRLGVRGAADPNILNTLRLYENPSIGIATPYSGATGGQGYRRYNRDQYGFQHVGGFWPLLTGERGHFAVMAGDLNRARAQLFLLEHAALSSGVIPEQSISISPAEAPAALGVACPLVWAHAENILLHRSIEEGAVFDAP